jgi:hypothetical protein
MGGRGGRSSADTSQSITQQEVPVETTTSKPVKARKIGGKPYDVNSKIQTSDPYTYTATASITINGRTLTASYGGDENESRKEVKKAAVIGLKAKARKLGLNID